MRPKDEILYHCMNTDHLDDPDRSTKAFYMNIIIEVLIDIRDILKELTRQGRDHAP